MNNLIKKLDELLPSVIRIVFSSPQTKTQEFSKINARLVTIKGQNLFQLEQFKNSQVFHLNLTISDFQKLLTDLVSQFKQINLFCIDKDINFLISKKFKVTETVRVLASVRDKTIVEHNRKKEYILNEGDDIPIMRELGIFTADNKIKSGLYDKFKQINRFVEIINDNLKCCNQPEITILDFGCGKSYLTFVLYHYFAVLKQQKIKIIGYDLKTDVIEQCSALAIKYKYDGMSFQLGNIKNVEFDEKIDMIITLHACDTATDYALLKALQNDVKFIFSVPCCQHEINKTITPNNGDLDILLQKGLFKERLSSLLTDAFRVKILESFGYTVDVLEFVDFSHSPKNVLLRAVKENENDFTVLKDLQILGEKYNFSQTLLTEVNKFIT